MFYQDKTNETLKGLPKPSENKCYVSLRAVEIGCFINIFASQKISGIIISLIGTVYPAHKSVANSSIDLEPPCQIGLHLNLWGEHKNMIHKIGLISFFLIFIFYQTDFTPAYLAAHTKMYRIFRLENSTYPKTTMTEIDTFITVVNPFFADRS